MKNPFFSFLLILFFCNSALFSGTPSIPENIQNHLKNKLWFTENKGQLHDQSGKRRNDILFTGSAGDMSFYLQKNKLSYQFMRIDSWKESEHKGKQSKKIPAKSTLYRLDLTWLNANENVAITGKEVKKDFENYYLQGNTALTKVRSYNGVVYENLYDRINLHFYQKDGNLKYDFIVAPGGNHTKIKIKVAGASNMRVGSKGELIIQTPLGNITEDAPLVLQDGKALQASWYVTNNVVSFNISGVDPKKELVIDPAVRAWGTYYGATGSDSMYGCATDAAGNVYVAGSTTSSVNIASSGAFQTTYVTSFCAYLVKFNSSGVRQWATYYGAGEESGYDCAVDANGDVYMIGVSTGSSSAMTTPGSHQPAFGGYYDAFVVKFNSSGTRLWGTYYGGSGQETGRSCAVDASGNLYLSGVTTSTNSSAMSTSGAHQTVYGGISGSGDAFLVKFSSSGARLWATYYGGNGDEEGYGCSTDPSGNVYLTGYTSSTNTVAIATAATHQQAMLGNLDAYLVKFNSAGVRLWGTYFGGAGGEGSTACATDYSGNVFISGYSYNSGTTIATPGAHQTANAGSTDGFIAKFSSSGLVHWSTYYGGTNDDYTYNCMTDAAGNIFVSGNTESTGGISTPGSHQSSFGGPSRDAFISKFSPTGSRLWGTYYGGTLDDYSWSQGSTIDQYGRVYLTGGTASTASAAIATAGAHKTTHSGGSSSSYDAFIVQFSECPADAPFNASGTQTFCAGNTVTLSAAGSGTINWYSTATSPSILYSGTNYTPGVLSAGVYTYFAAAVSCSAASARTPITLTVSPLPSVSASGGTICSGNSFTVSPTGATSYSITGGNFVVAPTSNTSYSVTGYGATGCASAIQAVVGVTVISAPLINLATQSVQCHGGTGNVTVTAFNGMPPYSYNWLPGGLTGSTQTLPAGNYTITVTGINLCSFTDAFLMAQPTPVTLSVAASSSSVCQGSPSTLTAQVTGGFSPYTYTWSSGGNASVTIVNPTAANIYTITSSDQNLCIVQKTIEIVANPLPTVSVNSGTLCSGQLFTLAPTGASVYAITGNTFVVSPNITTSYSVTGTSSLGCVSSNTAVASLTVFQSPTVGVSSASICAGNVHTIFSSATITPISAITFSITGGTFFVSPTSTTSYSIIGTSTAGCVSVNTAVATVTVHPLPVISVNSGSICQGSVFTIQATGASSFIYQGGSTTVSPISNTSYTVIGTSSLGCVSASAAVSNVSVSPAPVITLSASVPVATLCAGQQISVTANGANSYSWNGIANTASRNFTLQSTTSYSVSGSNSLSCLSLTPAVLTVTVFPNPTVGITSSTTGVCPGNTLALNGTGAASYTWTGGITNNLAFAPVTTDSYTVTGSDINSCNNTSVITVTVYPNPTVLVTGTVPAICASDGTTLSLLASGAASYTWNTGSQTPGATISPTATTNYTVTGTSSDGCTHTRIVQQFVDPCTGLSALGENDLLKIYPNPASTQFTIEFKNADENTRVLMYASNGSLVFERQAQQKVLLVDLSELPKGIYLVRTVSGNRVTAQKKLVKG